MPSNTTFQGYLLKAVATGKVFPKKYINYDSWTCSPSQHEFIKAYRDDNTRDIYLVKAEGEKTAFSFETRGELHDKDMKAIEKWFYDAETDHDIRKIEVQFWDNTQGKYRNIVCYRANPKYKIKRITKTDIIYNPMTIDLVEM